ncbi:unnamed protein product [Lactuca saligna]|uniref:Uncharacterized protein n=1 Tax=Lactuca saligna TaxID=75948 RepID=A0AA36ELF9_LACSI|nr:unnamed protein product [Lactuca saligna]
MAAANPNPKIANLWRTVMAIHRPMPTTMTTIRIQALDLIHFIREREGRFDEFNQAVNFSLLEGDLSSDEGDSWVGSSWLDEIIFSYEIVVCVSCSLSFEFHIL